MIQCIAHAAESQRGARIIDNPTRAEYLQIMRFVRHMLLAAAVLSLVGPSSAHGTHPKAPLPGVVLWAWERPEHLDFIDPGRIGVAFLAKSIDVSGRGIAVRSRMQPLSVPGGTSLIAVVRISTVRHADTSRLHEQTGNIVAQVLGAAQIPGCRGVQIDFDAKKSERPFYRALLTALREALPDSFSLSITALASWCLADDWISALPVDDAVPMLFRLGPDRAHILDLLASGGDFSSPLCRQSIGISTDEPLPRVGRARRVYAFSPVAWTRESVRTLLRVLSR